MIRVKGHWHNTVVRTCEEVHVSAKIRYEAVQSLVPRKICIKK